MITFFFIAAIVIIPTLLIVYALYEGWKYDNRSL